MVPKIKFFDKKQNDFQKKIEFELKCFKEFSLSERPDDLFFDDFIKISFAIKTLLF
jgi:hypothetical protein